MKSRVAHQTSKRIDYATSKDNIQQEGIPITKPYLDLLIISTKNAVDFLHLTVKEYLTSEGVIVSMRARADESLIKSCIAVMTPSISLMTMIGPEYLFRN